MVSNNNIAYTKKLFCCKCRQNLQDHNKNQFNIAGQISLAYIILAQPKKQTKSAF